MAYTQLGNSIAARHVPVRRIWIPSGDLGTAATLLRMREQAMIGAAFPVVQRTAREIVGAHSDRDNAATNLRAWLLTHSRFTPDPDNMELVRTPVEQLHVIATHGTMPGDCDDVATLGAALARALGMRARFVVLAFDGPNAPYQHVYTEVLTRQGWRDFDITRTGRMAPPRRVAVMEV